MPHKSHMNCFKNTDIYIEHTETYVVPPWQPHPLIPIDQTCLNHHQHFHHCNYAIHIRVCKNPCITVTSRLSLHKLYLHCGKLVVVTSQCVYCTNCCSRLTSVVAANRRAHPRPLARAGGNFSHSHAREPPSPACAPSPSIASAGNAVAVDNP